MIRQLVFLLILFVSGIPLALGSFDAYSESTIDICSCTAEEHAFTIIDRNPAQTATSYFFEDDETYTTTQAIPKITQYRIQQTGEGAKLSTLLTSSTPLLSGEQESIQYFINAPCGMQGTYELSTFIQEIGGETKQIKQRVNVNQCNNIGASIEPIVESSCPCTETDYTVRLTNPLDFIETYNISVIAPGFSGTILLGSSAITLSKDQSTEIPLTVAPVCPTTGEFPIIVRFHAQKNGLMADAHVKLVVDPCVNQTVQFGEATLATDYNESVFVPTEEPYVMCDGSDVVIPFTLTNTGSRVNNYSFNSAGSISHHLLFRQVNNLSASFQNGIIVYPRSEVMGETAITLRVKEDQLNTVSTYSIPVNNQWCRTLLLTAEDSFVNRYTEELYPLTVMHRGQHPASYDIIVAGPEWVQVVREVMNITNETAVTPVSSIELVNGSSLDLYLYALPPGNVSGTFPVTVTFATGNEIFVKDVVVDVKGVPLVREYWVYIVLGLLILLLLLLVIAVRKREKSKEIVAEPVVKKIEKTEKKTPKKTEKKTLKKTAKKAAKKTVNKSPKIPEPTDNEIRIEFSWRWIVYFIILLVILAAVFIGVRMTSTPEDIINETMNATLNETVVLNETTDEMLNQTIEPEVILNESATEVIVEEINFSAYNCSITLIEDQESTINLSTRISDPDGDPITFSYTLVPQNVIVSLEAELLKLQPEQGFVGIDYVEIVASDGRDGVFESGPLTICVKEDAEMGTIRSFSKPIAFIFEYRYYIITGFVLLVALIFMLSHLERKK